jgi:glucose-1-phosphate thymidylyltransferase
MKGIILAGGLGTRLMPLTKVTNKHLLPVYDKPMIYYPIQKLVDAGINEIMIVTGGNSAGDFLKLLGNGKSFGLPDLYYTYQEGEGGIADALRLCENFADGSPICVILGDNIFQDSLTPHLEHYETSRRRAHVILKSVPDPHRFGVAQLDVEGKEIEDILEKPDMPPSPYAVTGIYLYDASVFERIRHVIPSARGELEISDVNNSYIGERELSYSFFEGWWTDAGTIETLHLANTLVAQQQKKDEDLPLPIIGGALRARIYR